MSDGTLVTVRIRQLPLALAERSDEHHRELLRELALLAMRPPGGARELPHRLTDLVAVLTRRYAGFNDDRDARMADARANGEEAVDLDFTVPPSVSVDCRELDAILDEADEFCRRGEHLLTLATPPDVVAYRKWYLQQFVDQIEQGADPVPWPVYFADTSGLVF